MNHRCYNVIFVHKNFFSIDTISCVIKIKYIPVKFVRYQLEKNPNSDSAIKSSKKSHPARPTNINCFT